jgi:hypothetical protein
MAARQPSPAKIERAKRIALRTNQTIPEGALCNNIELSAWIEAHNPASDNQITLIGRWIASGKRQAPPGYPHAMTAAEARRIISEIEPAKTRRKGRQARRKLPWLVKKLLWIWIWIGCATPLLIGLFIPWFLLSTEWASLMSIPSIVIGLVSAATYVYVLRTYMERTGEDRLIIGGAALVAFVAGRNIAILAVPMIFPLFTGSQIKLPYTVVQTDGFESKGCRRPVKLEGLPFLFGSLCDFPDSFRHSLTPGMRIAVAGYGTNYGVYVADAGPAGQMLAR